MRQLWRSAWVAMLVGLATVLAAVLSTVSSVVALTGTALYMGGTDHPLTIPGPDPPSYIDRYVSWAYDNFVGPSELCGVACAPVAVYTPAEFWPITGLHSMTFDESVPIGLANLDDCVRGRPCTVTDPPFTSTGPPRIVSDDSFTVFSYSQSGTIASLQKSDLIAHPIAAVVSFVFLSNPNRPNGGILERFVGIRLPILGVTFNGATVTNSPDTNPLTTVDVVHQYDPVGDFPTNPLNLLADLNALLGFAYEHPEFGTGTPLLQGQFQDSTYYLIPSATLPLLRPLTVVPYLGPLLATVLDPPLRVLVETGYDRTINPGAPTPAKWLYVPNPITATVNFLKAIPNGWDNGIAYLTGDPANRPFGTTPQGPYGVGGPPVNAGAVDPYGPPTPLTSVGGPLGPAAARTASAVPAPSSSAPPRRRSASRPLPDGALDARTGAAQAVAAPAPAAARSAAEKRSAASSTGALRKRAWSAQ